MNAKNLLIFTSCSPFHIASTTAMPKISIIQNSIHLTSVSTQCQSFQRQESVISLDSANLVQPYILSISATQGTQLTGQITLNGGVVKEFKDNQAEINISPLLSKGRQTIKISGNYQPARSSLQVKFSGPGTQITQQTSGNGRLNQTLIIDVR